jgi:hypothetical protein
MLRTMLEVITRSLDSVRMEEKRTFLENRNLWDFQMIGPSIGRSKAPTSARWLRRKHISFNLGFMSILV